MPSETQRWHMRKALTDKTVEALKSGPKRYEVHDLHCPGLIVRVSPEGRKTFNAKFRYGTTQKRMTLGVYPIVGLARAREKVRAALGVVSEGGDPTISRRNPDTLFKNVVHIFIERHAKVRNKHWREAERVLQREVIPKLGERDIRHVGRADILEI